MDHGVRYLDVIQHQNPCTEDWEAMDGDAWVRHCPKCAQNVYNLSAMTAGEAERLLRQREGKVCTKLYRRPDGSLLTQRCPSGVRKAWGRALRVAAAIGIASAPTFAHDGCPRGRAQVTTAKRGTGDPPLSGLVADVTGVIIPGAQVELRRAQDLWSKQAVADDQGAFAFADLPDGEYELSAWSEGFVTYRLLSVNIRPSQATRADIQLVVGSVGGWVEAGPRPPMPLRVTGRFFRWIGSAF